MATLCHQPPTKAPSDARPPAPLFRSQRAKCAFGPARVSPNAHLAHGRHLGVGTRAPPGRWHTGATWALAHGRHLGVGTRATPGRWHTGDTWALATGARLGVGTSD